MSTYFNDIQGALDNQLSTLTSSPPVAWPNIPYEPSVGTAYLRPLFLPGDTTQAGLGDTGLDDSFGIYQVDVVYKAGTGRSTLPDSVADHFSRGTVCSYNGVNVRVRSVSIGPMIQDEAWVFVPVSISWQTFTPAR